MQIRALSVGVGLIGLAVTLFGCSGGDEGPTPEPTAEPTPPPAYDPSSVEAVWKHHLDAFTSFDLDRVMEDYDDESMVSKFNDKCAGGEAGEQRMGYSEWKGKEAIRSMFDALFKQLKKDVKKLDKIAPVVVNKDPPQGNVFLTWRTKDLEPADLIKYGADTFTFKKNGDKFMIRKHNKVTTEDGKTCEQGGVATNPKEKTTGIYKAWSNHFQAFATKNVSMILEDYTEESFIQVFDNRVEKYESFKGINAIKNMFTGLFEAIANATDESGEGIAVPLQQVEEAYDSVFLVWKSNSHPKATDTFVFDANHKISMQNIVVQTKADTAAATFVV
jgi:hypothetical protein